jgi:EmrB/QacA subfamily drug resistance transporter
VTAGYRIVALSVSTALFMQFLDSTALNTAIPTIARDMHVPAVDLNLAILSYQLAMTVLIPVGTAISDRVGQRNAFAISLLVFAAGSILCALSPNLPALVAARALQGAGGAVMTPVSRMLVIRSSGKSELISAMNWLLLPSIIGPMIGPALGGLIVQHASWHWIFLINVPVAVLGMVLAFVFVPDIHDHSDAPVDFKGIALIGPAIFALMFGLESAVGRHAAWQTPALLGTGLLLLWLFVRHARRHPAPVLDLSLLGIGSFRHSLETGSILRTVAAASGFIMPLWFQLGMGFNPAKAGAILILPTIGTIVSRLVGVRLTQVVHPRTVAIVGTAVLVATLLINTQFEPSWPLPAFCIALAVQSVAMSIAMMVISASTYMDVEPERMNRAAGLFTTIQQLTMSLGVTLGVWTISLMQLLYTSGEHDGRVYSGSILILAALAALGLFTTRKLDAEATGALRAARK